MDVTTSLKPSASLLSRPTASQVMEAVWSLVGQGLAFIDYSQPAAENWSLHLTDAGRAAAVDMDVNPDDPAGYLRLLLADVPSISSTVKAYAEEALRAYNARLYRASAVMLGVASEAAVLEVATALTTLLSDAERRTYIQVIQARKQNYVAKFEAFQQKLRSKKDRLPEELSDGLDLTLNAVADLLRLYRNDAGHPSGKTVDRGDCFIHLRMFVRYSQKLYLLKAMLEESAHA